MAEDILLVDYGLGNLFNIQAAFASLGANVTISSRGEDIARAKRIIVPGVGAYADGMKGLHERSLIEPLRDFAKSGRPMLGICLGMQLLLSQSEEWGHHDGLDIVKGRVVRLRDPLPGVSFKVPHIGWNTMTVTRREAILGGVTEKLEDELFMYFIHSYYVVLDDDRASLATTDYGRDRFCSAFQAGKIVGFQAHPERSGAAGLQVFRNFLAL